nr:MAG TPA: hypothetical protein [Caudoviricetes sp.]
MGSRVSTTSVMSLYPVLKYTCLRYAQSVYLKINNFKIYIIPLE